MTSLNVDRVMPKRSGGKRTDVPVKMDAEVIRKAKIVAAYRGKTLAEFLSDELGGIIDRLLEEEHTREVGGAPKGTKGKGSKS